jgi:hypothetical protein
MKRIALWFNNEDREFIAESLRYRADNDTMLSGVNIHRAESMAMQLLNPPKDLPSEMVKEHEHHYQHVGLVNAEHQTLLFKLYCVTCGDIVPLTE